MGKSKSAKNIRSGQGCQRKMTIATYYVQTLRTDQRLTELEGGMKGEVLDIIGPSELRRTNNAY